ncbi:transcription factor FER-LIKE IRON DEFICIENCY-INDUCED TRANSCRIPTION FACTOR [Melia azedarach]|uniref:Transcription factor FER-LIKE IRON DEFICIENCY-INDUCED TRANSCRIPTION FACTOR n=1 Tax=Melia azedarach TaxID=155640 RepID=A0ACC1YQX6_MELAZ|nr:transcription factor FER-LIKE IRON DEFICIENCY-INDUCED TRANSCRIPTION FACTOR [Melia azedarach]
MDAFGTPLVQNNDAEVLDFIDHPNFDQFVDRIRGENEDTLLSNFDCHMISGCCDDNQFGSASTPDDDMFGFNGPSTTMSDLSFVLNSSFSGLNENENGVDGEEDNDGDHCSGTTKTTTTTTNNRQSKAERSKTLISERKRRGRMKEKLYALRALVPNITKMDKASIIGDAVLYVQDLQMKAKKLKAEIAGLEASLTGSQKYQQSIENTRKTQVRSNNQSICKKILLQMDIIQVEERGFYLKLVCNKGEGVAVSLYKALESLTSFDVQNTTLATESERTVLVFTLKARESEQALHLPNLKLWVTGALMNQGFEILTPLSG